VRRQKIGWRQPLITQRRTNNPASHRIAGIVGPASYVAHSERSSMCSVSSASRQATTWGRGRKRQRPTTTLAASSNRYRPDCFSSEDRPLNSCSRASRSTAGRLPPAYQPKLGWRRRAAVDRKRHRRQASLRMKSQTGLGLFPSRVARLRIDLADRIFKGEALLDESRLPQATVKPSKALTSSRCTRAANLPALAPPHHHSPWLSEARV
jgi:hypothetical protein